MYGISDLLELTDAFLAATSIKEVTLSHRVFGDSKKICAMREGSDITVGRFNEAFRWFSANWPQGAAWPANINRPIPQDADRVSPAGPETADLSGPALSEEMAG